MSHCKYHFRTMKKIRRISNFIYLAIIIVIVFLFTTEQLDINYWELAILGGVLVIAQEGSLSIINRMIRKKHSIELSYKEMCSLYEEPMNPEDIEVLKIIAWGFLGFFIAPAGIILFVVWRKKNPRIAKSLLIGAVVSILTIFLLGVVSL